MTFTQSPNQILIISGPVLKPAPFRSRGKNVAEGNREPGLYSRKYGSTLIGMLSLEPVVMCSVLLTAYMEFMNSAFIYVSSEVHCMDTKAQLLVRKFCLLLLCVCI